MVRILITATAILCLSGCALTDASLDVGHDEEIVQSGPISDVQTLTFVPSGLIDNRDDKDRIGYKTNGFGMKTADITSDEPVEDIIMGAIIHAAESNGHVVGDAGVGVSGSVNQFWVGTDTNFWSVDVIGDIEVNLVFTDTASGSLLYERTYTGNFSDGRQVVTEAAYNEAISGAVQSLIDEIVFDEDLAEALRPH